MIGGNVSRSRLSSNVYGKDNIAKYIFCVNYEKIKIFPNMNVHRRYAKKLMSKWIITFACNG